ncbi:MAG: hypothetical protein V3S68_03405 [Dehalococcoidia bacterium]
MPETRTPERLNKAAALAHWHALDGRPVPLPSKTMKAVPYRHTGSTYAEDGIRINGSREFIDSVLAALQNLLGRENSMERIGIQFTEATDRDSDEPMGTWACYIQVHERGREKTSGLPAWTYRYR